MNHRMHSYMLIGLAAVAGVLLLIGTVSGSAFTIIWLAGCAAMPFFMTRSMRGVGTQGDKLRAKVDHTH